MRGCETKYYKVSEASEILGVKAGILRKWDQDGLIKTIRTPGGMRLFDISSISSTSVTQAQTRETPVTILYSRVSSRKQKEDLKRQQDFLKTNLPDECTGSTIDEVSDIGSGINFKRTGLLHILGRVKEGRVSTIVVASRDRLARFGYELIEWMCTEFGTKIVVLDSEDTTPESELGKDLMAIVQVYCCRWNGSRRYKHKNKESEIEIATDEGTETDAESMGRLCQISLQQDDCDVDEPEEQDNPRKISTEEQVCNNQKSQIQDKKQFLQGKTVVRKVSQQRKTRCDL
jgi:predicted site-specific integrase-resolvase